MERTIKTIGVLTSGGDAPGMNAAVRAVTRTAISRDMRVMGIRRGYSGLISGDIYELGLRSVSDIVNKGGTMLYSARCPEFKTEEGMQKAIETCKRFGIEGLVVIGGDGSYRGARDISERGIASVGIPGTIDNDITCTDYSIGFDTALDTVVQMVDRIRDTSQSHDRCTIVEIMGRHAGWLALDGAISVGATAIIVPEKEFDYQADIIDRINYTKKTGKKHFIIMVSENVLDVHELAKRIEADTQITTRADILGYAQRGGSPTPRDRILASRMGNYAVDLLSKGIGNRVVCIHKDEIVDYDIFEALKMKKPFNFDLLKMANEINI